MGVEEIKYVDEEAYEKLSDLYKKTGNCAMNGYIGDSILDCNTDGDIFMFSSSRQEGDIVVNSMGCLFDNSLLIRQLQRGEDVSCNRLYSWDLDDDVYTSIDFDYRDALNTYYKTIKRMRINLNDDDLPKVLMNTGLNFNNVIRVNSRQKIDSLMVSFDEDKDYFTK